MAGNNGATERDYPLREAADALGVTHQALRLWHKEGRVDLKPPPDGKRYGWRIPHGEFQRLRKERGLV